MYFLKPFILFGNSVICYVFYWKHMKRVLHGQAEVEVLFVTQHSLYARNRRKPEGTRKAPSKLHILSIFPVTLQNRSSESSCRCIALVLFWTARISFRRDS